MPVQGAGRDEFQRYLDRCASTAATLPGVLFLQNDDGGLERHPCHGIRARLLGFEECAMVLLHLDAPTVDRRFKVLAAKLHDARRVMQERRRRTRELQSLMQEREELLLRLEADAAARVAAERERDGVLAQLYRAGQDERRRLARDLHDHAGQHLVALNFGLRRLLPHLTGPAARNELDGLLGQAQDVGEALRRVTLALRPAALDEFGFVTALRYLVDEWGRATRIGTEMQVSGDEIPLPSEHAITLHRLTQEALTNVAKHAGRPSYASVVLLFSPRHLTLTIDDDGVGFEADEASTLSLVSQGKLGLIGMRERMSLVGGTLDLESSPGQGTSVIARVHLAMDAPHDV
ncbi:sensor histidine kinase [Methylobacterium sp. WL103]|uniref:sensor histidine kinase n=1 Tax=Methylobacterium sp. WL103 TaxID=2603891 RepID=UPI001FEDD1C1|nr:sensor histidine kinase [Methylobacterium sp. WL103]